MKSRYQLTLVSKENGWEIEVWDSLHHMWLSSIQLGKVSQKTAVKKLHQADSSLN